MITRQTAVVPIGMEKARQRFERWRSTRLSRRSPIPEALWNAAVAVARQHGRYATSRALGLDYAALKKRMDAAEDRAGASPTFVELPPTTGAYGCVIEIEGARATVCIRVPGLTVADLAALSRTLAGGDA